MSRLTIRASSLKSHKRCERLAHAQYACGLKSPATPATARGKALHKIQEDYLRDGVHPREAKPAHPQHELLVDLACRGLEYLPKPGTCAVESEWTVPLADGIDAHGTIDLWDRASQIWDHKTSSNIAKWALTERTLLDDVQATLYAWYALAHGGASPISLRWIYYQCSGKPRVVPVDVVMSTEHVERKMIAIRADAQKMLDVADRYGVDWLSIDADVGGEACYAYNGCHLLPYCMQAREAHNMSELLDKLKAEAAHEFKTDAPDGPAKPPAPPTPPVTNTGDFWGSAAPSALAAGQLLDRTVAAGDFWGSAAPSALAAEQLLDRTVEALDKKPSSAATPLAKVDDKPDGTIFEPDGPVLLIDCVMVDGAPLIDGDTITLSAWLNGFADQVATARKVAHWSLCEYGKGPGELAAAVKPHLDSLNGVFVLVDSADPACRAILPMLQARATFIIRGIR